MHNVTPEQILWLWFWVRIHNNRKKLGDKVYRNKSTEGIQPFRASSIIKLLHIEYRKYQK